MNENFFDLGAHSLTVAEVQARLQEALGREIALVDLFQFSTVSALAGHLAGTQSHSAAFRPCPAPQAGPAALRGSMKPSTIAIVGMAGRFPGARNIPEFWQNLRDGVESIRDRSDAELLAAGASPRGSGQSGLRQARIACSTMSPCSMRPSSALARETHPSWTRSTGIFLSAHGKRWRTQAIRRSDSMDRSASLPDRA